MQKYYFLFEILCSHEVIFLLQEEARGQDGQDVSLGRFIKRTIKRMANTMAVATMIATVMY